jgi:hypothetical protein
VVNSLVRPVTVQQVACGFGNSCFMQKGRLPLDSSAGPLNSNSAGLSGAGAEDFGGRVCGVRGSLDWLAPRSAASGRLALSQISIGCVYSLCPLLLG